MLRSRAQGKIRSWDGSTDWFPWQGPEGGRGRHCVACAFILDLSPRAGPGGLINPVQEGWKPTRNLSGQSVQGHGVVVDLVIVFAPKGNRRGL